MKKLILTVLLALPMISMTAQTTNNENTPELKTGIITSTDENGNGILVDSESGATEIIGGVEDIERGAFVTQLVGDGVIYITIVTPVKVIRVIKDIKN
ncbi:MAG: hypothetical protein K0Q95_1160 [Bacteroidota bacterium]|jgi:hypothetical protein|nr:hypothetical protein [Bacteroidota bacterium]